MNALIFYTDGRTPEYIVGVRSVEDELYPATILLRKRYETVERKNVAKIELTDFEEE